MTPQTQLINFWRGKNQWYWLDETDCKNIVGVDLNEAIQGLQVDTITDSEGKDRYRLRCHCKLIRGYVINDTCLVHGEGVEV